MPPPPATAAALKRILEQVFNIRQEFFSSTYLSGTEEVPYYEGMNLVIQRRDLLQSDSMNMGYTIALPRNLAPAPGARYSIWLLSPSCDPEVNRGAFYDSLHHLIYEADEAVLSHTINMAILQYPPLYV